MENPMRSSTDFWEETLQARREWHAIFNVKKGKNLQSRIFYAAKIPFRFDREIKSFRQEKSKRVQHHQTIFATNAKGLL